MTRKEKEKILLDGLELRVGDRIQFLNDTNETFTIKENEEYYYLKNNSNRIHDLPIMKLIICEFTIIAFHLKTYGEYICKEIKCSKCPLRNFRCIGNTRNTIYQILENSKNSEDYSYLKSKLDRVVEDENEILN